MLNRQWSVLHGSPFAPALLGVPGGMPIIMTPLTTVSIKQQASTLFAVKLPNKPGSYNTSIKPLEELLAGTVGVPPQVPREVRAWGT